MAVEQHAGGTIFTGDDVAVFQMLAVKGALHLEVLGMKHSHGSVYKMVKTKYGFKGNKQAVYDQYVALLREKGVLR